MHTAPALRLNELALPLFDDSHRELAMRLDAWLRQHPHPDAALHALGGMGSRQQVDDACRAWVSTLGDAGWLRGCVSAAHGGWHEQLDSRTLVVLRQTLAFHSPLADFALAMQGLGSGAITLGGTPQQQGAWLPYVGQGRRIMGFALSEPDAGSDVAAMQTTAVRSAGGWVLNGQKTWISNGGIAHGYTLFAKTDPGAGSRGVSAFILPADAPGLRIAERIDVMAPHPLATLALEDCTLPAEALLGEVNGGFKLAMRTLDIFRASVAGAALGMGRRALAEALAHAKARKMFGAALADLQLTQAKLGDMAALMDAAALLTARAAWLRDTGHAAEVTAAAAMAKMAATENAQRVIDMAVQLHGGLGVKVGTRVEALYRDIRSLRIYEGATEVQQLIIARELLKGVAP